MRENLTYGLMRGRWRRATGLLDRDTRPKGEKRPGVAGPHAVPRHYSTLQVANILNALPKSVQGKARANLKEIWHAPTIDVAERAVKRFVSSYGGKYPQAVAKLTKDEDALLAFYDFPAEHWLHIRTSNPIESTFATVRHRSTRTRNCVSRDTFLGLAFKLIEEAEKSWQKINGADKVTALLRGDVFKNGEPVKDNQPIVKLRLAA